MATYTKEKLSGSTNGKQIKVAATYSPGTTIHTAVSGTTSWDEVWLYAVNNDYETQVLYIEWGGTADPDDAIYVTLQAQTGLVLVIPGLILQNGLVVKAYCDNGDTVEVSGYVNRIAA